MNETFLTVIDADVRHFIVAAAIPPEDIPSLGAFLKAPLYKGGHAIAFLSHIGISENPIAQISSWPRMQNKEVMQQLMARMQRFAADISMAVARAEIFAFEAPPMPHESSRSKEPTYIYGFAPHLPELLSNAQILQSKELVALLNQDPEKFFFSILSSAVDHGGVHLLVHIFREVQQAFRAQSHGYIKSPEEYSEAFASALVRVPRYIEDRQINEIGGLFVNIFHGPSIA